MPRFDRGVVNTKLEKGDIVLMGNPTQYGEILAENILVEDILKADLETLISGSNLVRGKFYRITNAVSSTLSLLVQGLTANTICDYAYNTANGDLVTYNISTDLAGVPFSSVYVPYTGATTNVDLGEYQIKVGQLELDQTPTGTFDVAKMRWNDSDGTAEIRLKGGNVTLQIGQEQLARVVNKTNTNLTEAGYQVVRISGAQGQRLKVGLAQANSTSTCKDTLGLVTENISNNAEGFITTSGLVRNINTTGSLQSETWADGDRLYLSPSVAGGITNVEPSAPNIVIVLGYVVYAHANQGSIYVSVEGAKALHELFDVSIPTPTNNNVLVYESSTGLWKDKSISTILGFTPIANNATVGGELSGTLPNPSLVTSAVTGKALTGLSVSGSAVVSTDSILTGIGKLQNQINAVVGSVNFQGVWNASTNSPSLASGVGTKGYYYIVSVAGSTNLDGITDWKLGDWAIYDGSAWQKVDNTDAVVSVNGYTGIVTLAAADVGALPTSAISGTTGKLPKFTASGTIGDSIVSESGSTVILTGQYLVATDSSFLGYFGKSSVLVSSTSANDTAIFTPNNFNIGTGSSNILRLQVKSNGQIITNLAADTGEAHIFGGSARVNGNLGVNGSIPNADTTIYSVKSATNFLDLQSTTINQTVGVISRSASKSYFTGLNYSAVDIWEVYDITSGASRLKIGTTGQIITANATNTGEHFIIGGSARVNGETTIIGNVADGSGIITLGSKASIGSLEGKLSDGTTVWQLRAYAGPIRFGTDLYADLQFYTNGITNPVLNITKDSNVGIGTTSPSEKLTVNGNLKLTPSTSIIYGGDDVGLTAFSNSDLTTYISLYGSSGSHPTTPNVIRLHTSSTERMRITSGGNVLIGTTTDDGVNKLQVSGSGTFSTNLRVGTSTHQLASNRALTVFGTAGIEAVVTGTNGEPVIEMWQKHTSGNNVFIDLYTDSTITNRGTLRYNRSGNQLELVGLGNGLLFTGAATFSNGLTVKSTGYGTIASFLDAANSGIKLVANASVGYNEIISDGNQPFLITVNSAERFRIAGNGAATFSSSIAIGNTVTASVATPSTHKVEMVIGGVTYYLLATT